MSLIHTRALSKHYGSTKALDQFDLQLEPGEPIALVGPNGAGKTTLLSLICGFIQPSSGDVNVLGHKPGSASLVGRLAALPQDARFDPALSIGRQLGFYAQLQGMSVSYKGCQLVRLKQKSPVYLILLCCQKWRVIKPKS